MKVKVEFDFNYKEKLMIFFKDVFFFLWSWLVKQIYNHEIQTTTEVTNSFISMYFIVGWTDLLKRLTCFLRQLIEKVISDSKKFICFILNVIGLTIFMMLTIKVKSIPFIHQRWYWCPLDRRQTYLSTSSSSWRCKGNSW